MAPEQPTFEATLRDYKARLLRVLVYLQQHLDGDPGLEELAAVACFSPFHFHRIFRGMIGESVREHVRRLRLERAASRLKLTTRPVTEIALDAGYAAPEAFTRAFRDNFGLAPSQFRARGHRNSPPPIPSGVHYRHEQGVTRFRAIRHGGNPMTVTIKHLEPTRVAFMRHVGPYSEVASTWDRLCTILGKEGWLGGEATFIGICHDDPEVTPADRIRYDACVTVDATFRPVNDLGVQVIPGGDYAVMTHQGPYHKLNRAYAKLLGQWLPRSGCELRSAPCFEVYLNSPESTAPRDLLTDLHAPLEPRRPWSAPGLRHTQPKGTNHACTR